VIGFTFLYAPMLMLVIYSFNSSKLVTVWAGWSTRWYSELFHDDAMMSAVGLSLTIAAWPPQWRRSSAPLPQW
jgi:putrescine transport system permease protein